MTSYPGESPPDGEQPDAGTEPTQPVGYWERQAAERAREQGTPPDPTRAYPEGPYPQSGQPSGAVSSPIPHNPYPSPPSGQQQPYGDQAGYPPRPGQAGPHQYPPGPVAVPGQVPYTGFSSQVPDHPSSTLALVLGLVGLVGAFFLCGVTLVVAPFAWAVGANAVKEIEASQGRLGGLGNARAGKIMGIIGTVLLILAVLAVIAAIVLLVAAESTGAGSSV